MVSAAILLSIIIPLICSVLLDIPSVQNGVVHKAAEMASRKLGTTVSIGRIDIGLFSRVHIHDFYVEDYGGDTLLYVRSLRARLSTLGAAAGGIELSRGDIRGAKLYLKEMPGGEMNIKQVVNRISDPNREKKGNFRLALHNATIDSMELRIERLHHRNPVHGVDYGNMRIMVLKAEVDNFTIDGQSVYTTIERLAAREQSGFRLNDFSGMFYLAGGCLGFQDVHMVTPLSDITIPYISLVGDEWSQYRDFIGEVRLDGRLRNTRVATDDIAFFAPSLRDWHLEFSRGDITFAGMVDDFEGEISSLAAEGTALEGTFTVKGLPDIEHTHFDITIPQLRTSAESVRTLAQGIARKQLPQSLVEILARSGDIDMTARFSGLLSSFTTKIDASTSAGGLHCDLMMKPMNRGKLNHVEGRVATRNLQLGHLLDRSEILGGATIEAQIDGIIGRGHTDTNIIGDIHHLELNDYVYDSLHMDGRLLNRRFNGMATARDPNLDFDFLGIIDLNDSVPRYNFSMDLRHADLARLKINRRDSVSRLRARIEANAGGRSLDDLNGSIKVTGASYDYNDSHISNRRLTITGENSEGHKHVTLRSDFADAVFHSPSSYHVVFDYLRRSALRYVPLLRDHESDADTVRMATAVADEYSTLSVNVHDITPLSDAISPGLQIADGSSLHVQFNPVSDNISLRLMSKYVERQRMLATHLSVMARNEGDSLITHARAEDLYLGALHLPRLEINGGARDGRMELAMGFTDSLNNSEGRLGVRAEVADSTGDNGRQIDIGIHRSMIRRGDKQWNISARQIRLDTARVVIDRFLVHNGDERLMINGTASHNRTDSVTLQLHNFDLTPLTQFAGRLGYTVEGRTNGKASVKSLLNASELVADIDIDDLEVNGFAAPPMELYSRWDFTRSRAGVTVRERSRRDTLVRGFFDPNGVRYYARLRVDSLNLGLLDPLLRGVISSTSGTATADLVFQGQRRNAELRGEVRANDFRTTVDFTQVEYRMPSAVLKVTDNRFDAANVEFFDPLGNRGKIDFTLNMNHLSNISYDLRVRPQQMLVLDTDDSHNEYFYGRLFASGRARISGDKGNVKMDIAASTDDNSSFYMPMSSKSNISYADFVHFARPERDSVDIVTRRKMLFERRRNAKRSASSRMDITMALDVRPNVDVELMVAGNAVKARGEGVLNLEIKPESNIFDMYGDYTIQEGNYNFQLQNIINKRFLIESGSTIQWTGSPMDALLDIDAIYKVKASLQPLLQSTLSVDGGGVGDRSVPVDCVIHLGDRLTNPAITFDVRVPASDPETQTVVANALSTPEDVDKQFLYLMLLNSFYADSNSSANADIGTSVSAATGLEFLSNMLSNLISADDYNIVLRYRPKSELTSDEVDFGLSKSLVNDRLLVEVEGNYVVDNKQAVNSSMSNFMGEAYITYLIDRAGALKVKAFTQTIDRFDENQGQQETGVGIYFKEDFHDFKNFRERIKARFTNKKRQERREARRAEKKAAKTASERAKNEETKQIN